MWKNERDPWSQAFWIVNAGQSATVPPMRPLERCEALKIANSTCHGSTKVVENSAGFDVMGPPASVSGHIRRMNEVDATLSPKSVAPVSADCSRATYNSANWDESKHPRKGGKFATKGSGSEPDVVQQPKSDAGVSKSASGSTQSGHEMWKALREGRVGSKSKSGSDMTLEQAIRHHDTRMSATVSGAPLRHLPAIVDGPNGGYRVLSLGEAQAGGFGIIHRSKAEEMLQKEKNIGSKANKLLSKLTRQ